MRTSISCDSCRRAKVKCLHTGTSPCQRCVKSKIAGCVLSKPQLARKARNSADRTSRRMTEERHRSPRPLELASAISTLSPTHSAGQEMIQVDAQHPDQLESHLQQLPREIIFKILDFFTHKVPEISVFHLTSFTNRIEVEWTSADTTLLATVLGLVGSLIPNPKPYWANSILMPNEYALFVSIKLQDLIFKPPKIEVVQTLLISSLYEWGICEFHKAWMYCGVAMRMMQAIHSSQIALYPLESVPNRNSVSPALSVQHRTFWACFIMDRMITSGTYNPPMLSMMEMIRLDVPRPLSTVDFALGSSNPATGFVGPQAMISLEDRIPGILEMTHNFEILALGFDIWSQVMTFVFKDGRRAPGMSSPSNCPWSPTSPWYQTRSQLEKWRASQSTRLYFPEQRVATYMSLGYGESFLYINLLYYISTLMLHREYFPFLPHPDTTPQGPIEPPLLEEEAPAGWWDDSGAVLFGAVANVAELLHEAVECGVQISTPFIGFCAFSGAYMNLYISLFPQMNLGRSRDANTHYEMCLKYLEEFRSRWKLGETWLKIVHHTSLLYHRAANNAGRYRGKASRDFNQLHTSVHEFRGVDRSREHILEIEAAESGERSEIADLASHQSEGEPVDIPLSDLLADVSSLPDEQGAWAQWWPTLGEFDRMLSSGWLE